MTELTELNLESSADKFLDKTCVLYGESGTGKSVIIVDILNTLKPHIDQCIVFSPTDRQNGTYGKGIIPPPLIHYTFDETMLNNIWLRQEALVAVYQKSNKIELLKNLYCKLPSNSRTDSDNILRSIDEKLEAYKKMAINEPMQINQMAEDCREIKLKIYKRLINDHESLLQRVKLSEEESYCLKYHNINPRLVLIFDDCTDLIKKYRNSSVMQKLFYQGRHSKITALIACHTDKALEAELKKNAAVSIFTEYTCACAYFTRGSGNMDKDSQKKAIEYAKSVFYGSEAHCKLMWVRHEKKYYKFTAVRRSDFQFCNEIIWDYSSKVVAEAGKISSNNPFITGFK